MLEPFRTRPKSASSDYSRSHLTKGLEYHEAFATRPGRALMWALEQEVLRDMIQRVEVSRVLDFACGTGRVAGYMKELSPAMDVHGVDISASMLEVATSLFPNVYFHRVDGRQARAALGARTFDLVTAFRFFANADALLRQSAIDQIFRLLEPGGHLIFNNHRNFWSLSYVLGRLAGREGYGAENKALERLFVEGGFELVERRSLGVWPQSEKRSYLLPWRLTRMVERANLRTASGVHALGYNMIWLLRKPA